MVRFPTHFHKFLKAAGLQSLVEPNSIKKGILPLPSSSAWGLPTLKARAMSKPLLPPFLSPCYPGPVLSEPSLRRVRGIRFSRGRLAITNLSSLG